MHKTRFRLGRWLGLYAMPTWEQFAAGIQNAREDVRAVDAAAKQRHEEMLAAINGLTTALQAAHAFEKPKPFTPAAYDWETVQQMALQQMEREADKEN